MIRFLTAGESHGKALVGIIEGIPSGLPLTAEYIHSQLKRRKLGYGRGARQKMEDDSVEILSGVRHGMTLGSPIALLIQNRDWQNWKPIMQAEPFEGEVKRKLEVPRPGHADYIGGIKYNHADMRNVLERASARETAMRVALGSVVRKLLEEFGVSIASRVIRIGTIEDSSSLACPITELNTATDASPLRVLDRFAEERMMQEVDLAKKEGDTLGGVFEVQAAGHCLGLGSYSQWDRRLEGKIAQSLMSLNAIKGVEVGMGFHLGGVRGSQAHDEFYPSNQITSGYKTGEHSSQSKLVCRTNRSGGIDGGMTTGQPLIIRAAMKPLATLMKALDSVKLTTGEAEKAHVERSDVCAVPAAAVIGESLVAFVLGEAFTEKFGGDSLQEMKSRVENWQSITRGQ